VPTTEIKKGFFKNPPPINSNEKNNILFVHFLLENKGKPSSFSSLQVLRGFFLIGGGKRERVNGSGAKVGEVFFFRVGIGSVSLVF